jgi:REP element-mobilizing transposase RayT
MGYHPRQQYRDKSSFVTIRTRNSELWFANNPKVEERGLGLLAKFADRYQVELYAFAFEGNHYHLLADFLHFNRSDFARDFNSGLADAVKRYTSNYTGGSLWARRYSAEIVPGKDDIERQFFYTALQPVQDGLVEKLSQYPFYNFFHDAICGIERKFKIVRWGAYNAARRYNKHVNIKDFTTVYTLKYKRLPGYEHLSQKEYKDLMLQKLELYRQEILAERWRQGKTEFLGPEALLETVPGTPAKKSKKSTRHSHRPRVLSVCNERRAMHKKLYFHTYFRYKEASKRFLAGELDVQFPPNMFRPPSWMVPRPSGPYSLL